MTAQELMLTNLLGCQRIDLYADPPVLSEEQSDRYRGMRRRLDNGEPLQYILGGCEFMGIPLKLNPSVLIPRPETELLVERVLETIRPVSRYDGWNILDLGTGSGNIAVALAKFLPGSHVTTVEISEKAIALAQINARDNGVEEKITFIRAGMRDLLNTGSECFDVIVSNPPYIRTRDLVRLPRDVQQEPRTALDGGEDGLDFYRVLIGRGHQYLKPGGFLFMEIGDGQARDIENIADEQSCYDEICFYPDYTQTERIVSLQRK
ncbi:MAG: peptide chain release factor N(5)-glutamine methyltransferase [Candidatus Omnitrophica bacterium]|nr:peptide chain release factor N(5)-glutamine methyltransferase [Candidatus Omnitrophota bacterium]